MQLLQFEELATVLLFYC